MAIVKWDPLQELRSMQEEMNRLFELSRSRLCGESMEDGTWQPPVDIFEEEGAVVVKMEIPEVDLEDVQVGVENNNLIIQGVRRLENGSRPQSYLRLERSYGHFRRLFALPEGIDPARIGIRCERGVLRVEVAKSGGEIRQIGEGE